MNQTKVIVPPIENNLLKSGNCFCKKIRRIMITKQLFTPNKDIDYLLLFEIRIKVFGDSQISERLFCCLSHAIH